jgi:hypothetical protein
MLMVAQKVMDGLMMKVLMLKMALKDASSILY